jgi:hypothetical protein
MKPALQRLQFRYVAVKDCDRTRNTVMVPTAAVAHLQPPMSSLDAVPRICLAVVGLESFINFNPNDERFNSWH